MDQRQRRRRKLEALGVTRTRPHRGRLPFLLWCGFSTTTGLIPTRRRNHPPFRSSPSTTRIFVVTTPEAIIEQASTTKLLDDLIDESVRTSARRPIMMQFDPSSGWIWKRWKGTVFSETWDSCVARMLYASVVFMVCRSFPQIKDTLSGFAILWGQLLSVTTFTLTFFVNQSYALWRKCSELSRRLQGRLHDMDMTLAAHATRKPPTTPNEASTYTAASRQILELVSRYVRLFNLLTYASFTRSHRPVLTPRGMRRLVERGLMTPLEREVLVNANIPATQRHNAVLLWIIRAFIEGKAAGHFTGDAGFEQQFIEKAHVCRASYGAIGDELQGRMPFAYAHIVQVLVDLVLVMYPFMAYSAGMSGFLCVLGTGLLTIGYQGLVRRNP
jgi:predicted membrane chloride channel (bestrophin family)